MVSNHANNHANTDVYANVMQGKVLFPNNQLPEIVWNQIKILVIANKDGRNRKTNSSINLCFLLKKSL